MVTCGDRVEGQRGDTTRRSPAQPPSPRTHPGQLDGLHAARVHGGSGARKGALPSRAALYSAKARETQRSARALPAPPAPLPFTAAKMATATRLIQRLRNFLAGVRTSPGSGLLRPAGHCAAPPAPQSLRRRAAAPPELLWPCLAAGPPGEAAAALRGDR